jgi:CheY-like chemotaxis protein
LIEQEAPDVVVSDRAMPGLDGLDLCRRIRNAPVTTTPTSSS